MCFLKVFIYLRVAGAPKTFQSYWTNIKHRCCFSLPVWCFFSMFYRCQSEGSFLLWCQNVHGKSKRWWKGWKLLWTLYPTSTKERDVDATDGSGRKWSPKNVSMEIQGATKMKIIPEAILTWAKHEALPHCHAHSFVYKKNQHPKLPAASGRDTDFVCTGKLTLMKFFESLDLRGETSLDLLCGKNYFSPECASFIIFYIRPQK